MATYVSLINWTEQGIRNFRDTAQRAADFSRLVESVGGKVRELLWTVGEYDIVCVADFPDEESGGCAASGRRGGKHPLQHDAGLHGRADGRHHSPDWLRNLTRGQRQLGSHARRPASPPLSRIRT
jgi:GYD domain